MFLVLPQWQLLRWWTQISIFARCFHSRFAEPWLDTSTGCVVATGISAGMTSMDDLSSLHDTLNSWCVAQVSAAELAFPLNHASVPNPSFVDNVVSALDSKFGRPRN